MKHLLFCVILSLGISTVFGQSSLIGVKVNPQLSWLSVTGEGAEDDGTQLGTDLGLVFDLGITENCFFNTGLSLVNTGGMLTYSDTVAIALDDQEYRSFPEESLKFKNLYLSVPVALKFKTSPAGAYRLYADVGIDLKARVRSVLVEDGGNGTKHNVTSEIAPFNLAYHFGAGIEFYTRSETAIQTGFQFSQGFIDVTKLADSQVHQNNLALCVNIFF